MAYYWLTAAVLVFILELLTGTIYLLVLSLSLVGGALVAWGLGNNIAFIFAALLSLIGCTLVWRHKAQHTDQSSNEDNDLDIGQIVIVEQRTPIGEWRVHYRGASWEARLQSPTSGSLNIGAHAKIVGRDGNVLLIETV